MLSRETWKAVPVGNVQQQATQKRAYICAEFRADLEWWKVLISLPVEWNINDPSATGSPTNVE